VARLVQDLVRDEAVNVGIVLQSEAYVRSQFVPRIPRSLVSDDDLANDIMADLQRSWDKKLANGSELLFIPSKGGQILVDFRSPDFLEWLKQAFNRHLQFSEVREAEVDIDDPFSFETLLVHLYNTFVVPRPQPRRPVTAMGTRLHTMLRRDFRQSKLLDKITEGALVEGTILWQVDFAYRNHREVAMTAVDFNAKSLFERAGNTLAVWADLRDVRKQEVWTISVVNNYRATPEHRKALSLVERYASATFNYESERPKMLDLVATDLEMTRLA
jgi:hypothetical protein